MKTEPTRHQRLVSVQKESNTELLIRALHLDACPIVRHEAAFRLGDWPKHRQSDVLTALLTAAGDPSVLVRHEVALALANFKTHEAALLALIALIKDPAPDVAGSAVFALLQIIQANPES